MLAMIGTVSPSTTTSGLGALIARLRNYQAIRVSEFEAVLLIPAVGAVLVDTQPTRVQFQLAAATRDALDGLIAKLTGEVLAVGGALTVEWMPAVAVPVPLR